MRMREIKSLQYLRSCATLPVATLRRVLAGHTALLTPLACCTSTCTFLLSLIIEPSRDTEVSALRRHFSAWRGTHLPFPATNHPLLTFSPRIAQLSISHTTSAPPFTRRPSIPTTVSPSTLPHNTTRWPELHHNTQFDGPSASVMPSPHSLPTYAVAHILATYPPTEPTWVQIKGFLLVPAHRHFTIATGDSITLSSYCG